MTHESHVERWRELLLLLRPVHDDAVRTARRLSRSNSEGDDLFHEALLRAWDRLSSLRDRGRFRSWFFAVLLSVHRNRCRRGFWKRFLSLDARLEEGLEPRGSDGERDAELRSRAGRASRALASLPPEQREAVVLFEMEGYSIEEIARFQESSIPAVKSRLSRGRERLRRCYEKVDRDAEPDRQELGRRSAVDRRAGLATD